MNLDQENRTYHEAQSSMELLPNYYDWIYGKFNRFIAGDVIELGCGAGLGMHCYAGQVRKVIAVDHNPILLERIAARFPGERVTTVQADLLGNWDELAGLRADAVLMMDVVEHFRDDVSLLRKAAQLLKPDGHMIIKVPAQADLYCDIDRASGHFRRYDPPQIAELAEEAGLRLQSMTFFNRLGAIPYRFKRKRKTNFSKTFSSWQLAMINRAIPFIRMGDALPFLPGLSIIAVLGVGQDRRA